MFVVSGSPRRRPSLGTEFALAGRALRAWGPRQVVIAAAATLVVAVVIGLATVLIPNSVFARDIPPVWWNYPVWVLTSVLSGILVATYVRPDASRTGTARSSTQDGPRDAAAAEEAGERRHGRMGMAGGILAWFAVGCPVCNKIALLALGYSGAITWFAPVQPYLALVALVLTGAAAVARLRGQVACTRRPRSAAVAS